MNLRLCLLNLVAILMLVVVTVGVGTLAVGAKDSAPVTETRLSSQQRLDQLSLPHGFEGGIFAGGFW